jgi:tRNA pseudouridine55 synthase
LDGFINLLKPPGMTSHDVVAELRRLLKMKKIGHTGTLDPGVAGVLPVCLGKATRLAEYLTELPKSYRAEITFGISTDSQDAYGTIQSDNDCRKIAYEEFVRILPTFIGDLQQLPPMTSAVKVDGKPLYQLARAGIEIQRARKSVRIYSLVPVEKRWTGSHPQAIFDISCSKGTFIRTLCNDIGERMGIGAYMSYLVRTGSGPFRLTDAATLEEITAMIGNGDFSFIHSMADGVSFLPGVQIEADQLAAVIHGNSVPAKIIAGNRRNAKISFAIEISQTEFTTLSAKSSRKSN